MNSVQKVKSICKERKIPISKLERDLGYGNGYIGQLKKGTFPADRIVGIANYLGVSVAYLTGENEKPTIEGELTDAQREAVELIMQMSDDQLKIFIATLKASRGE